MASPCITVGGQGGNVGKLQRRRVLPHHQRLRFCFAHPCILSLRRLAFALEAGLAALLPNRRRRLRILRRAGAVRVARVGPFQHRHPILRHVLVVNELREVEEVGGPGRTVSVICGRSESQRTTRDGKLGRGGEGRGRRGWRRTFVEESRPPVVRVRPGQRPVGPEMNRMQV